MHTSRFSRSGDTYEEFPGAASDLDAYEPLISEEQMPEVLPLLSPLRGITERDRSLGYRFYDPDVGSSTTFSNAPATPSPEPQAEPLQQMGYEFGTFAETGYLDTDSVAGYLPTQGSLDDELEESAAALRSQSTSAVTTQRPASGGVFASGSGDEEETRGGRDGRGAPPLISVLTQDDLDENYIDHVQACSAAAEPMSRQESMTDLDASLETINRPLEEIPQSSERAVVLAGRTMFRGSSLEIEDLFAEVVRKTGAIYGRQKLMEFLRRTADYFGERALTLAIEKSVAVTSPTLLNDSGHLSRTVWNEKFQAALEIQNSTERNERLASLRADFISTAEFYGRIILAERWLPVYRKSIKPISLGGVAGGTKYLVQGILYKFAEDVDLGNGRWMYGGEDRNDAAASKACGNELKGLSAVFQASPELDIRVPLMCLVDFSGFRISAQAFLPVGSETLIYGSRDGGKTILSGKGHPRVLAMMSRLAQRLRLEPHIVVDAHKEKHLLYTPTDIEVHLGYDGRYYLLDSARLMPPQSPPPAMNRAVFYQLFRPEFLTWYDIPLSPDGYTRFGMYNWKMHNNRLKIATGILVERRIPEFARQLTTSDAKMLTSIMHSWGINVRFLGQVRHRSTNAEVRAAALLEMIARTLQKILQERLRDEMARLCAPQMSPYLHLISDFFNTITSDPWFWKKPKMLKGRLVAKFGLIALSGEEREARVSLASLVDMSSLLGRLSELAGIHMRSGPRFAFENLNEPFVTSDFTMVPRITEMDIASLALAEQYRKQAKRKQGANKLTLLRSAAEIFAKASISNPHHLSNRVRWLRVIISILRHSIRGRESSSEADENLEREFARADTILQECLNECNSLNRKIPEVIYLQSSLLRQRYHNLVNSSSVPSSALMSLVLEHWVSSYELLLLASSFPSPDSLHVGLNVYNNSRFEHRKAKRWMELSLGLSSMTDLREMSSMANLLGPVVARDELLARFMVSTLEARPCTFGVLFVIFRSFPKLLDLLKLWLNRSHTLVPHNLTMEYLEDSVVANYIQLCTSNIVSVDLTNCSGCTNDVLFMLARTPSLTSLSLRRCTRITDEGVRPFLDMFSTGIQELNLSFCPRITDRSFLKRKLPVLRRLVLEGCVSLEGEFLTSKGLMAPSLEFLDLQSCHRLSKPSMLRLSSDIFPQIKLLDLSHTSVASGQVVASLLKNASSITVLKLRNTPVSDKAFRPNVRHVQMVNNLTRLNLHDTDIEDDTLGYIAAFPHLTRLNLKQCANLTDKGVVAFVQRRPENAAPMTHLDITDTPRILDNAMQAILCELPGAPHAWQSLKLRGCTIRLGTLQQVLLLAAGLRVLSLSGRQETDLAGTAVATRGLERLSLEACSWNTLTLKQFVSPELISLKLRSCPNLGDSAMQSIILVCSNLRKLHLISLPVGSPGCKFVSNLQKLKKLCLQDLEINDEAAAPLLRALVPKLSHLVIRDINWTDVSWKRITSAGINLKSFKMSRCPIRNSPNRLLLLPRLQELHLAPFSTPPFEHGESAADLHQLRVMSLAAAICANASAFEHLGYSQSLQKLIVLPHVPPNWWSSITEKPIRHSLTSLFIAAQPQAALPFLRGFSSLTEINLREPVARGVMADIASIFPLLVFPVRSGLLQSRNSAPHQNLSAKSRQQSLVRAILNTSTPLLSDPDTDESSSQSSTDISMGWALLSEAHVDLQLDMARLLLDSGYKLVLVYRSNRSGAAGVVQFASRFSDSVIAIKTNEFFDNGVSGLQKLGVDSIELVLSGLCGPSNKDQDNLSVDQLRRSMTDITYAVVALVEVVKPLVMMSRQKLVVITTSLLGSISANFTGRSIPLRAATAALNQVVKSFSIEAEEWGGCFVLLSPQASEMFPSHTLSDTETMAVTAAKMVRLIGNLSFKDNGIWYNTSKQVINW